MGRITIASLLLLVLFITAVCAQNKPKVERLTNGPVVKEVTTTSAEVTWSTDEPASSIVKYGTDPRELNRTAEEPWGGGKEPNGDYNHTVWIKNLKPNTTYYFMVESGQGLGTGTGIKSSTQQFRTR
jgi:hypothetical protein